MNKAGGWNHRGLISAGLLLTALTGAADAQAAARADELAQQRAVRRPPKTTAECMEQWHSMMADPRPDKRGNGLPPDEMCMNSRRLPADEGRCKEIYQAVLKAYTDAEKSVKELCALVPKAYAARCDGQGSCQQAPAAFQQEYASVLERHNNNVLSLISKMDEMAQLGMNQSEKFANDLRELKGSMDMTVSTETARRHGGATIADALRNHSGQDAETVLRILQRARETSTISQSEIERQIKSPYVFESLQASAVALDQKRDLEQYARNLSEQRAATAQLAATGKTRTAGMGSLNDSGLAGLSLPSSIPSLPMAAGAAPAGNGGLALSHAGAYPEPAAQGVIVDPAGTSAPRGRNQLAGAVVGNSLNANELGSSKVATAAGPGLEPAANPGSGGGTAASQTAPAGVQPQGSSLRELLRARMAARRSGGGIGEGVESSASSAGGTRRGNFALGPDGKPLVGGAELDSADPNAGRMPPMAMKNSETEGAVKAMVSDFEQNLGGEPNRAPASEEDNNAILASDTPSLFLRLKQVHVRCIQRGCVTQLHGKGKI